MSFQSQLLLPLLILRLNTVIVEENPKGDTHMDIYGKEFREEIRHILTNPDAISKEELFKVFKVLLDLYLKEVINTGTFERAFKDKFGEEEVNDLIDMIVTNDLEVQRLDSDNMDTADYLEKFENTVAFLDTQFGLEIEENKKADDKDEDKYDDDDEDDDDDDEDDEE